MNAKTRLKKINKSVLAQLKRQYFVSDIPEVKSFLLARGYEYTKTANQYVSGWYKEKQALLAKTAEMVKDSISEDLAEKRKIDTTELQQMKHTTVQLLKAKLNELNFRASEWIVYIKRKRDKTPNKPKREGYAPEEVKSSEVIEIMNAIKRELGEPLTIAKIHNSHSTSPELTDDESLILDMLDTLDAIEIVEKEDAES